jgi:hypothetical protein
MTSVLSNEFLKNGTGEIADVVFRYLTYNVTVMQKGKV